MGTDGVGWAGRQPGYGAYAVTLRYRAIWTPLVDKLIAKEQT